MLRPNFRRPWTEPLDCNLHATDQREIRVPFPLYVQPKSSNTLSARGFPRFLELPAELRLRVLDFCDAPELFQLMRVSRAMRILAKSLFWSYSKSWYLVNGSWLLAGGFPGPTYYSMSFLRQARQIEVEFEHMRCLRNRESIDRGRPEVTVEDMEQDVEEQASEMWQTLQARFPCARHVVVSESSWWGKAGQPPEELKTVMQMCPAGIFASASFTWRVAGRDVDRVERSLCRWIGGKEGRWEEVCSTWTRQSILPPPKRFRGPVGEYQCFLYWRDRWIMQRYGAKILLIEAWERHHFHERHQPFRCPDSECEERFDNPGEWTLHATISRHDREELVPDDSILRQVNEVKRKIARKRDKAAERLRWDGLKEKHEAQKAFLHQLEHDPQYAHGMQACKTLTWIHYNQWMEATNIINATT